MKISPEETRRIRKILLLNLVAADVVIGAGLLIYFTAGHRYQMIGFYAVVLGIVWVIMAVGRLIRFKRFLAQEKKDIRS